MSSSQADWMASNDGSGAPLTHQYLAAMSLLGIQDTQRSRMLDAYSSFCDCTQHDHHRLDWDGVPRDPGVGYMHERLAPQGFVPVNAVPSLNSRKPHTSLPLATQIVSRFTEMLLGQGRRPALHVDADEETQCYLDALFGYASLWDTLAQARDVAGACGSSLIACSLVGGQPAAEVLHPRDCWVPEWDPSVPGWRPRTVIQQRRVEVTAQVDGSLKEITVWQTRAWTVDAVYSWPDVPEQDAKAEGFAWPAPDVVQHGLGTCPVVWLQNTRSTATPDGQPDCAGCWHLLDQIDRLESRVYKAVAANVSPQLVLKEEERLRRRNPVIQRGVNSVIALTPQGEAKYLEMDGEGIRVAREEVLGLIDQVLQTAECVVVRPEHAKAYQSGEALQILWRAMESRANRLRVQLECAVRELSRIWILWGKKAGVASLEDWDFVGTPSGILLPPKRVEAEPEEVELEPGEEPPEPEVSWVAHSVGEGSWVRCEWPPYWQPTAMQTKTLAEGLAKASGGKPFMSTGTAVRVFAQYTGQDPQAEIAELERQSREAEAKMAAIMAPGVDDEEDGEPGGDEPGESGTEPEAEPGEPAEDE